LCCADQRRLPLAELNRKGHGCLLTKACMVRYVVHRFQLQVWQGSACHFHIVLIDSGRSAGSDFNQTPHMFAPRWRHSRRDGASADQTLGRSCLCSVPIGFSIVAIRYFNFSVVISTGYTLGRPDPLCPEHLRPSLIRRPTISAPYDISRRDIAVNKNELALLEVHWIHLS
jgi:hypothetical protein